MTSHQARPLRVSLPAERDPLTRPKTDQSTINERPTERRVTFLSLEPPFDLEYPIRGTTQQGETTTGHCSSPSREGRHSDHHPLESGKDIGRFNSERAIDSHRYTTNPMGKPTRVKCLLGDLQGLQPSRVVTLQSLSALPPYSRKPGPYGPTMSICAKVMSRGVHNIAFSLSPDDF